MRLRHLFLAIGTVILVAGCSGNSDFSDLRQKLEEIKQKPRGRIEPPPEFKPTPTYTYAAHKLRSPFVFPQKVVVEIPKVEEGKKVEPPLGKPKEFLERFSMDALKMVGTMQKPGEGLVAIISAGPTGGEHIVKVGNYLGRNYGRITEITETKVSVIEIVPDGHGAWVERPRVLAIEE